MVVAATWSTYLEERGRREVKGEVEEGRGCHLL